MGAPRQGSVIVVEPRYIDRAKLTELLARLFPPKTYAAEVSSLSSTRKAFSVLSPYAFCRPEEGNG
jgi:hypothetical protein